MKRLSMMINGRSSSKTRHASAAEQAEAEKITTQKLKFASLHEEEDDEEAAYRLGQTPIKKGKVSSSKNVVNNHQQKFVCNKCGKAFQSSKAMCGHMACHSEKEKPSSNAVAKKKLVMDSESDTGSGAVQMRRRSRRARCKENGYAADSKVVDIFDVVNNCLSEASGIEQEQEEVAICLMMLSRDSANWGGLNSIGESSDNNSVVLEDRSISTRLRNKAGLSSWYDMNEDTEKHSLKKMDSLGNFNTGFASNGVKNVETGVKIRNFRMNKFEEDLTTEPHLSLKKLKSLMDCDGYSQNQRHTMEPYPGKGALNEFYSADLCKSIQQKALISSRSPQPFDVSVASNKQFTAASPYGSGQNSLEADEYHSKRKGKGILDDKSGNVDYEWKKDKYESLACYNDYGSGHEVHLAEESDNSKCDEVPSNFKQNGIQSRGFIDLNLPAPMEDEEANESLGSH